MKLAVLDAQGFQVNGEFVVKELAISNGQQIGHFLFKSLANFSSLSRSDKKSIKYLEDNVIGIRYSSGFIQYEELNNILKNCLKDIAILYVNGADQFNFLTKKFDELNICGMKMINVENYGWTPPVYETVFPSCICHDGNQRMCSLSNCHYLYGWIMNFLPQ